MPLRTRAGARKVQNVTSTPSPGTIVAFRQPSSFECVASAGGSDGDAIKT
jgi:hypothetical protein